MELSGVHFCTPETIIQQNMAGKSFAESVNIVAGTLKVYLRLYGAYPANAEGQGEETVTGDSAEPPDNDLIAFDIF